MDHLPPAVRSQVEKANRMIEERLKAAAQPPAEEPPAEEQPTDGPVPETPPVEEPAAPEPAAPEAAADEPESDPLADIERLADVDELQRRLEQAEQRYRTLQGKYNAETRELRDKIKMLEARLTALQEKEQAEPAAERTDVETLIQQRLQKYRDTFDDETLELVADAVRAVASKVMDDLTELRQQVTISRAQALFAALDRRLPRWREQDVDPEFNRWLDQQIGPYATETRRQALNRQLQRVVTNPDTLDSAVEAIVALYTEWPGHARYATEPRKTPQPALARQSPPPAAQPAPATPSRRLTRQDYDRLIARKQQLVRRIADPAARQELDRINRILDDALQRGLIR